MKIIGYTVIGIFSLIVLFLVGLTVYDSIRIKRLEYKVAQLPIGTSKEKVIQLIGKPNASWKKGDPEFTIFGKQEYYENSGMAYGKIMDWENSFHSDFPYFFPFKIRFFYPNDRDDILIYLNENAQITKIEIPK